MADTIEVFIASAPEDEALLGELENQLSGMVRQDLITIWHGRKIHGGAEWEKEIRKHLTTAPIILLLVSPDFIASEKTYTIAEQAMEKAGRGESRVIPILLHESDWEYTVFGKLKPFPSNRRPVASWPRRNAAFLDIARGIREVIAELEEKAMPNTTFADGYALLIGANVNLPITTKDATALHDVLANPSRAAYPKEHIQLLTEEKATRQGILDAFDKLTEQVKSNPKATVIVYFSGHGIEITQNGATEYFLIPYGYNPSQRVQTAISGAEFSAQIEAIKARKLVVLLDCCHAAGMPVVKAPGETVEKSAIPLPPDVLHKLEQGSGHVIAASSRKDETSWTGDPYSVFTTCLIEALSGKGAKNPDGFARILDVLGYLFAQVPQRAFGPQHPFVNNIRDLDDNFPLCYYAAGSKEIPGDVSMPPPTPQSIAKPINSSFELQRLQRKQKGLQKQYDELSEKIEYLTSEYNRTAHPPTRFELKKQIEDEEAKLHAIEGELSQVEQQIASLTS